MEDYKKKYEKALEIAKAVIEDANGLYADALEKDLTKIFPELENSEDEMIRKEIISALKFANIKGVYDKHIVWLEKIRQKDSQVILPQFTFDDVLALQCCMETVKKVQEDKELYEQLVSLHDRVHDAFHIEKQNSLEEKIKIKKNVLIEPIQEEDRPCFYKTGTNSLKKPKLREYVGSCLSDDGKLRHKGAIATVNELKSCKVE